ncbi:Yip1 domain-containing protein [Thelephora terrestris]|uniref:Protein YIP n=1 Tax=Thelephora terrestris TaxID=56493 RepID=A0A9P6L1U1_9AGAM|nr:Yip1 domain-containing protein [Thelephora terrestris]
MDAVPTPTTATSQFIQADDDDDIDESAIPAFTHPTMRPSTPPYNKGKLKAPEQLSLPTGSASSNQLSGNIGTPIGGATRGARQNFGGIQVESRSGGIDTLDEPIVTTIARDLKSIYHKLIQVLYPPRQGHNSEVLRDWDLWGPLVLCLGLGALLSFSAPAANSIPVFTAVIVIVSLGSFAVTIQTKLLGGKISFLQGLCVLGYCIAPLNVAALVALFVQKIYIRAPVSLAAWAWCIWAAMNFLSGSKIEQQRILLAVYPLLLFYFILAWMILIQ